MNACVFFEGIKRSWSYFMYFLVELRIIMVSSSHNWMVETTIIIEKGM